MVTKTSPSEDEGASVRILVVLPRGLARRLDAKIDREAGETRSTVVRRAIAEHVRR